MSHVILKTHLTQAELIHAFSNSPPPEIGELWLDPRRDIFLLESHLAPEFYLELRWSGENLLKLCIHPSEEMPRAKDIAQALNNLVQWTKALAPQSQIQNHTLGRYANFS